jgi:hypothetical protein
MIRARGHSRASDWYLRLGLLIGRKLDIDALSAADLLADTPLFIVHSQRDAYCSAALARGRL